MTTINAGEKNVVLLNEGQILTVTGDTTASGTVYKCVDSSATDSSHSWDVSASSSRVIGPFSGISIMLLTCSRGKITAITGANNGAVSDVNSKTGMVVLTATDVGAAPAPYLIGAVHFDGANSSLHNASLASVDGAELCFSFWARVTNTNVKNVFVSNPDIYNTYADFNSTGLMDVSMAGPTTKLFAESTGNVTNFASAYRHFIGAVKTDLAAGNKIMKLYVDDVNVSFINPVDADIAFNIATNALPFYIGDATGGDGATMDLSEFWFAPNQSIMVNGDIPVATRRKFRTLDGKPVDLGANGSIPTGTAPAIFFHRADGADASTFANNLGTGGSFTLTGTMVSASGGPGQDTGFASPMLTGGDMIIGGAYGAPVRLPKGTEGQILKIVSGIPTWVTP